MVEASNSVQVKPKVGGSDISQESRIQVGFDHPVWALYETQNSFTFTPLSPICVQSSLTIDKTSLKAQEHSKSKFSSLFTLYMIMAALTSPSELRLISEREVLGLVGILNI